jgi:branched-chain amino acid transport system permease protein
MLVGAVYFSYRLNRIRIGYYWTAIRSDQDAAESVGINAGRYRLTAFLMSCALSALAGTFYAQYYYFITPARVLDISLSLEIALMGVVGGWQTVFGPMIGAFILVPISEAVRAELGSVASGLHLVIYGVIFVLIILFMPKGINEPFMRGIKWLETKYRSPSRNANNDKVVR